MSPVTRVVVRAILAGVGAANGALLQALPGISADEGLFALLIGIGTGLAFSGIEVGTPVNKLVGVNKG